MLCPFLRGSGSMSEILLFTIVAVGLYLLTDWILRLIEQYRGEALPNRSAVFFVIIMLLSVTSFQIIQRALLGGSVF